MCGICGKVSPKGVHEEMIRNMARVMVHRGPDEEGFYVNGNIGLGHRRLSIIDLEKGTQPISNEDVSVWIVFNGEIYNYRELRKEVEMKGHIFKTDTDTEVIVHLYEDYDTKCVDKLHGMFAFAIWDDKKKQLFLARDRLGQKPLFYTENNGSFLFASEIKSILQDKSVVVSLNKLALHNYLSLRFIPSPDTMFEGIKKLPPAHTLTYKDGQVQIERYWDLQYAPKLQMPEKDVIAQLKELLIETIRLHLVSDVPVGSFLSGGLDSSLIVAIMSQLLDAPVKTFSIGVKEGDFNELPYARVVANRYHTDHKELVVQPDLMKLLPEMIWHLDEPSDPIAACMYYAAKLASEHVKVTLGGDGGDELFAGFDRYVGYKLAGYYGRLPTALRRDLLDKLVTMVPDTFSYKNIGQKIRWLHSMSFSTAGDRYASSTTFFRFNHGAKEALYTQELWMELGGIDSHRCIVEAFEKVEDRDPLDRMLYADIMTRLPEHSLMLTDRMTMAHGVESRSPLLDHKLAEFAASIPSHLKLNGRTLKYIQREVAKEFLPIEIVRREKHGFGFPMAYWLNGELREVVKTCLLSSELIKDGYFRREYISQMLEEHQAGKVDHHVRLWMLLNLDMWYRMYILRQGKIAL